MKSCIIHLLAVFIICCFISGNCKQSYTVTLIDVTNNPGDAFAPNLRIVGRSRSLNGTFAFLQDLNDNNLVRVDIYSDPTETGDYKLMPYTVRGLGVCQHFKMYYKKYMEFLGKSTDFDFQDGEVCPFPKGKYYLKYVDLDITNWDNVAPRGNIKFKVILTKWGKFVGGLDLIIKISNDWTT